MKCFTCCLVLGLAATAAAQEPASQEPQLPRWDVSGGLGLASARASHFGVQLSPGSTEWERGAAEIRIQGGRYFTEHLKGELAVSRLRYELHEYQFFRVPGQLGSSLGVTERTVRIVELAPAVTYQFFENRLVHPFLSGGVSINLLRDSRHRAAETRRSGNFVYRIPAVATDRTDTVVRPFVAGGFKTYFNRQAFLRPEVRSGFGPAGASLVGLRLDVGFDF